MAAMAALRIASPPGTKSSGDRHHHYPIATSTTTTTNTTATASWLRFPRRAARPDYNALAAAIRLPHSLPSILAFPAHNPAILLFPTLSRRPAQNGRVMAATKIAQCPVLDRQAAKHHRLRFVRKLTTLLLSKPRHFLPLRILSRHCRRYLTIAGGGTPRRSVLSMVLRYPAVFRVFQAPSRSSQSLFVLAVGLTPAATALAAEESRLREEIVTSLAAKLQRLLMLTTHRRILLSKLVHLAPDLGLPPDFRSRLCNRHPDRFRTVDTSYGRALELVTWDPALAAPLPRQAAAWADDDPRRPIIDRPPRFKQLRLRRGLNLKRRHRDYLIRFEELPEVSPFSPHPGEAAAEKRACAVVREVLGMTVERRTLVDHLTHLRKDLGLPNKLRGLLVRHPEMFYVSLKGQRDSVFLVEGYDDRGRMLHKDELLAAKETLLGLVREGKRLRRQRKKSTAYDDDDDDDDDEDEYNNSDEDDDDDDEEDEDGLEDLFDSGVGDDWEVFCAGGGGDVDDAGEDGRPDWEEENREFWIAKAKANAAKAATPGPGGGGATAELRELGGIW